MLEATMTTTSRWDLQGDPLPPLDWRWTGKHWVRQNDGPECGSAGTLDPTGPPRNKS